ncbi:MAG: GNAT family N-acetyltransferase [Anaerolineae bacterium]|jgi:ribosomal-protein-alanine N-acetyltransferase|nr:GNAT family N-acetyltransferase [Anaerolineae bacterium]
MADLFNFESFPTLETDRLILRELTLDDAAGVWTIRADPEVTRLNIGAPYQNITQVNTLIQDVRLAYQLNQEIRWGITLKSDPMVIGLIGFNYWDRVNHRASLGYDLARVHWRKGIMYDALRAVIAFGFTRMALNRIEADTSAANLASSALLRKLGFQQEGIQREQYYEDGVYHDLWLFALLRREWDAV